MVFEWDPAKNEKNIAKHGIDFEDAVGIFEGPVLDRPDERRDYGEPRFIAFGILDDREIAVVYTIRATHRRIISARRASKDERKEYRDAYPKPPSSRPN